MGVHTEFRKRSRSFKIIESRFYIMHPAVIFLYYICLFSFAFIYTNPLFIVTVCIFSMILAFYYNGFSKSAGTLKAVLFIGLLVLIINPLTNHRGTHMLFYFLDNPVTLEVVLYSFCMMLLIITMFIAFLSFNVLLDSERFLYLFSRVLPRTAFITNMTLRFSGLFRKRASDLIDVQNVRGMNIKEGKIKKRIENSGVLLEALTSWSLEEGMMTSETLKAKGYSNRKHTSYSEFKFTISDACTFTFLAAVLICSYYLSYKGAGKYSFYPRIKPMTMSLADVFSYILMVISLGLPFIFDIKTSIRKWRTKIAQNQ